MLNLDIKNSEKKVTLSQTKYEKIAKNNFKQIKKIKFNDPESVKIVGIQQKRVLQTKIFLKISLNLLKNIKHMVLY